jgi:predicted phosphodiesterase
MTIIGLIADTHCTSPDGADLPDDAVAALAGSELIVHLGDLTSVGVLDRLATAAREVIGIRNSRLDPPAGVHPRLFDGPVSRSIEGRRIVFAREYPSPGIDEDADVVAYGVPPGGGGHDYRVTLEGRVLIVSPGSPNLPLRHNTVGRLHITTDAIDVEIVHL